MVRYRYLVILILALAVQFLFLVGTAGAATEVSGAITSDTTWTAAESPYYVTGSVTVNAGVTLTVEPGVVVKFAQNTGLDIYGALNAQGASGSEVYFTDYRDDAAGGDTNGDGGGSSPAAGWWGAIRVRDGGAATLDYCVVRYGGSYYPFYASIGNLYKTGGATLSLTNSVLSNSANYGLYLQNTSAAHTVNNNTFENNASYGILLETAGSGVTVSGNTVQNNQNSGIAVNNSSPTITGNTSTGNTNYGIYLWPSSRPAISGNTLSGNTRAPLGVAGGDITADTVWDADVTYYLEGTVNVPAGKTLTVSAGRVVKFAQNTGLDIYGALNAQGASGSEVYFTDYRDDAAGGDTNGDGGGSSPAAGWWGAIRVRDGGAATLNYCVVRYGGSYYPFYASIGNLYKTGGATLSLTNSVLSNSANYGLRFVNTDATHTVSNNTFKDNASHGILLENAGSGVTISGNTVQNNQNSGIYCNNSSPAITGNTCTGNTNYGIYLWPSSRPAISGNSLDGNTRAPLGVAGGDITADTVWDADVTYYLEGTVNVPAGKTLTVSAGRVVKFAQNTGLDISGALNAQGTVGNEVYFTDCRDDTVGGDTNGDGGGSSPAAGWWGGIYVRDGGAATLDYCVVRYGGSYYPFYSYGYNNLIKVGAGTLTLTNSVLSNSASHGLRFVNTDATHTVSNNTFKDNASHGILLENAGSGVTISGNTVQNNQNSGIYCNNSSPAITGNTCTGNTNYGIYVAGDGTKLPSSISGNSLDGNTVGPIGMAAACSGTTVADDNTFTGPLHIDGGTVGVDTSWSNNRVYYVRGTVAVGSGKTLTIAAGRVVKFAQNTGLDIYGALNAQGTVGNEVYFTDCRDDTVGGDTNGDGGGSSPAAGWWGGIYVRDSGAATLDYCVVRYGGSYYPFYSYGYNNLIKVGAGTLTLTNSVLSNSASHGLRFVNTDATHTVSNNTFKDNASHGILLENAGSGVTISGNTVQNNQNSGIYCNNSSPAVTGNTIASNQIGVYCTNSANPVIGGSGGQGNDIYGNTTYGVQNTTSSVTVNAKYNYWGAASGPYHATANPAGTGDKVSDYVDFSSFLRVSAFTPAPFIEISPDGYDFGDVSVGSTSPARGFTVTNSGTADLTVGTIEITGSDAGQFAIQNDQASGQTLTPGQSASLEVVFAPASQGAKSASLRIPSNDPANSQLEVSLAGTGVLTDEQAVAADKAALTFDVIKGTNTAADSITSDLTLPGSGSNETTITWQSSDTGVVENDGTVHRPSYTEGDKQVTLTATISKGTASDTKIFDLTVKALADSSNGSNRGGGGGGSLTPENSASKLIEAGTGGSVRFGNAAVEVPAGALPADATLKVERLTKEKAEGLVPSGLLVKLGSDVYAITTTGERNFGDKTITIRIAYDPAKIAEGEQPVIRYFDETKKQWIDLPTTAEQGANGKWYAVTKVNHLTKFAVFSAPAQEKVKKVIVLTLGRQNATVDENPYLLDAVPYVDTRANRTLVPIRFISEALGAKVDWDAATRRVAIKDGGKVIVLTLGVPSALVDGQTTAIDCAPAAMPPGRTFVPLRFVSETLGAVVDYDPVTRQITITR